MDMSNILDRLERSNILEEITSIELTQLLYQSLRKSRQFFNLKDFKWRLGTDILKELNGNNELFDGKYGDTVKTLYGIDIEIDYANPRNLRLFEDITSKLGVL